MFVFWSVKSWGGGGKAPTRENPYFTTFFWTETIIRVGVRLLKNSI